MKKLLISAALISAASLSLTGCKDKSEAKAKPEIQAEQSSSAEPAKVEDLYEQTDSGELPVMTAQDVSDYLKANSRREGVITTDSGLQYTINRSGDADGVSPKSGQNVKVHYEGKFINGTVFDSSYERGEPAVFPSDRLIDGWVEALSIMKPGDEWTLYISPELGYGDKEIKNPNTGETVIPENSILLFRMELLENM